MASKTSTTGKPRTFDVLLRRLARAQEGVTFASGNYVRKARHGSGAAGPSG